MSRDTCAALLFATALACGSAGCEKAPRPLPSDASGHAADAAAAVPADASSVALASPKRAVREVGTPEGVIAALRIDGGFVVWLAIDTSPAATGALFRAPLGGGAQERLSTFDVGSPKDLEITDDAYLVYSTPLAGKESCTTCGLTRIEKSAPHATTRIAAYREIGERPRFTIDGQDVIWYSGAKVGLPTGVRTVSARGGAVKMLGAVAPKAGALTTSPQVSVDDIVWVRGRVPPTLDPTGASPMFEWIGRTSKTAGTDAVRELSGPREFLVARGSAGDFVFALSQNDVRPYAFDVVRMTHAGSRTPMGRIDGWVRALADADATHVIAVTKAEPESLDTQIVEVTRGGSVVLAEHQDNVERLAADRRAVVWVTYGKGVAIRVVDR